jgi:hypothetical protein
MQQYLWGALSMGCAAVALYFFRYWRTSRDPLFIYFSVAFAILGLNWVGLAVVDPALEGRHILYLLRLAAFVLIIVAIVNKNRRNHHRGGTEERNRWN